MPSVRVLIVDDSFFMRKLLRELFQGEDKIEVVGEAKNGNEAVKMADDLRPDVITMDFNMPEKDGAEAAKEILGKEGRRPAIIMLSAATKEGAEETLKSLRAGAVDFVTKPSGELSLDIEKIKKELITKVRIAARANVGKPKEIEIYQVKKTEKPAGEEAPQIVVIGASTGGPPAVEDVLTAIPGDLKIAIIVVQHMPEKFTRSFADRLDKLTAFRTKEAEEGELVKTGACLIAPGNYHMEIKRKTGSFERIIHLTQEAPQHGLRPAIDVTMKSVAENFSGGILGVILTGMGHDGTEGMRKIKERGGYTIVQSPETAIIDSMPMSVIESSLADEVVPLDKIAKRIIELSGK